MLPSASSEAARLRTAQDTSTGGDAGGDWDELFGAPAAAAPQPTHKLGQRGGDAARQAALDEMRAREPFLARLVNVERVTNALAFNAAMSDAELARWVVQRDAADSERAKRVEQLRRAAREDRARREALARSVADKRAAADAARGAADAAAADLAELADADAEAGGGVAEEQRPSDPLADMVAATKAEAQLEDEEAATSRGCCGRLGRLLRSCLPFEEVAIDENDEVFQRMAMVGSRVGLAEEDIDAGGSAAGSQLETLMQAGSLSAAAMVGTWEDDDEEVGDDGGGDDAAAAAGAGKELHSVDSVPTIVLPTTPKVTAASSSAREKEEPQAVQKAKKKRAPLWWLTSSWGDATRTLHQAFDHVHTAKDVGVDGNLGDGEDLYVDVKNSGNQFAILNLCIEFATLAAVAFRGAAFSAWGLDAAASSLATIVSVAMFEDTAAVASANASSGAASSNSSFLSFFWGSFVVALVFPVYALPGIRMSKKGTLGADKNDPTKPAKLMSAMGMYTKGLSVLASSVYMSVVKTLVGVVACDYTDATKPTLLSDGDIECWAGLHVALCCAALLAIATYFPAATFLFPQFQFNSRGLDIKYDTSYVVFVAQAKLFLAGVLMFFPAAGDLTVVLLASAAVCAVLAVVTATSSPCLVQRVNIWRSVSFGTAAWAQLCTVIVVETGAVAPMAVLLVLGTVGGIAAGLVVHGRRFGLAGCCSVLPCCRRNAVAAVDGVDADDDDDDDGNDHSAAAGDATRPQASVSGASGGNAVSATSP